MILLAAERKLDCLAVRETLESKDGSAAEGMVEMCGAAVDSLEADIGPVRPGGYECRVDELVLSLRDQAEVALLVFSLCHLLLKIIHII